jgi:hypothetical protein
MDVSNVNSHCPMRGTASSFRDGHGDNASLVVNRQVVGSFSELTFLVGLVYLLLHT